MVPDRVLTIGHSTHGFEEFLALLEKNSIELVADIRTVPKSKRHPQFHTESLAASLPGRGVLYRHLPKLGGWRKPAEGSINSGWRNKSFRGYADYTATSEFQSGLDELVRLADQQVTAMMCSEALWWRCHRRLVSDRLIQLGVRVRHIGSDGRTTEHELTDFAVVDSGTGIITYPVAT